MIQTIKKLLLWEHPYDRCPLKGAFILQVKYFTMIMKTLLYYFYLV